MSKNVVFMMDIDIKGDGRYSSSRRLAYKYSIIAGKKWKFKIELFLLCCIIKSWLIRAIKLNEKKECRY